MLVHRHTTASTKESGSHESTVVSNTSIVKEKFDKTKTKKPKVKTGCFTCKIRRVKCDEAKPYCKRCLRFGVDCDGYPATYRPSPASASRKILPKDDFSKVEIPELSKIQKIYSGPQFEDEQEGRYFRLFCEETADQLSGPAQSPLWKHLIPQACEAQPFVRHVVVAIAALSKINAETSIQESIGTPDYLYALNQYSKSLRGMRRSVESGIQDMRNALLACILVFCFETLQGNPGTAAAHARSGLMLLHLWMQEHLDKKVPFYEVGDWTEFQINREIMSTFAQLDAQIFWFLDTRPEWVHHIAIEQSNAILERMPARLLNIDEVRLYGCLMLRRNYRFVLLALAASRSKELGEEWSNECEVAWEGSTALSLSENILGTANLPITELMEESLAYREDIRRFNRSTALFFDKIRENGTQKEKVIGALWEMYCLMGHIMLAGVHFTDETEWDQFLPEFQRILALGQYCQPHLMEPLKGKTRYRFDLGAGIGLCLVAWRCRHRPTRHAAIDLLRSAHYREGIIDSHAVALIGFWLASIEEEGMDERVYIPGHKRVFLTRMVIDLPNRRALLGCSQKSLEGLVHRKGVMTW